MDNVATDVKVVETKESKISPEQLVREYILDNLPRVKYYYKTDVYNVFGDCFRVNVWTKEFLEESQIAKFDIVHSFFVRISEAGEYITTPQFEEV